MVLQAHSKNVFIKKNLRIIRILRTHEVQLVCNVRIFLKWPWQWWSLLCLHIPMEVCIVSKVCYFYSRLIMVTNNILPSTEENINENKENIECAFLAVIRRSGDHVSFDPPHYASCLLKRSQVCVKQCQ